MAVAVSASVRTSGKASRNRPSERYLGRKSCPQVEMQCACVVVGVYVCVCVREPSFPRGRAVIRLVVAWKESQQATKRESHLVHC